MSEFDDNTKQQQNNSHQGVAKLVGYSNFKRHNPMTDRFQVGGRPAGGRQKQHQGVLSPTPRTARLSCRVRVGGA